MLFVDMDGVLADFDRHHESVVVTVPTSSSTTPIGRGSRLTGCSTPRSRRWRACRSFGIGSGHCHDGESVADTINMLCPDLYTDLGRLARHRGLAEQSLDPHFC